MSDPTAVQERFWSKVNRGGDCWLWTGKISVHGYGHFHLEGRLLGAHRVALLLSGEALQPDLEVDHLCRVRACVNPAHLEQVTHEVNEARKREAVGHHNSNKTHCPQGHEYTSANTRWSRNGKGSRFRICRTCDRACHARRRAKKIRQPEETS